MGSTPRERLTQIPLPTRSTEAGTECFGRIVLSYLREDEQADASFFILGDMLHQAIELTIINDWDWDRAWEWLEAGIRICLDGVRLSENPKLDSSQRSFDTMLSDARRMLKNWFTQVHPDSEKRHPVYDDWQWPPLVEQPFYRTDLGTRYPVWGSVDAVFQQPMVPKTIKLGQPDYLIVDWKSGVKRPQDDFQLNFYRFGMGAREAKAHYHMLDRVQKRAVVVEAGKYDEREIRQAISVAERRKDAVLKGTLPKFEPDWYCSWCPVQHICPEGGDYRDRKQNLKDLRKAVKQAEPLLEIKHHAVQN